MRGKVVIENSGILEFIPGCYKDQKCVIKLLIIVLMH